MFGAFDLRVPQKLLQFGEVAGSVEKMDGKGMVECMRMGIQSKSFLPNVFDYTLDGSFRNLLLEI